MTVLIIQTLWFIIKISNTLSLLEKVACCKNKVILTVLEEGMVCFKDKVIKGLLENI